MANARYTRLTQAIMGTTASTASSIDAAKTIDTQVTLPVELYQAIAQRAQTHGHSVSGETVALLTEK